MQLVGIQIYNLDIARIKNQRNEINKYKLYSVEQELSQQTVRCSLSTKIPPLFTRKQRSIPFSEKTVTGLEHESQDSSPEFPSDSLPSGFHFWTVLAVLSLSCSMSHMEVQTTVIPRTTQGLERLHTSCCAKLSCADSYGPNMFTPMQRLMKRPNPSLLRYLHFSALNI